MMESFLIKSYDGVLLKTFARKNTHSENSQDKKKLLLGNTALNFKVFTNKLSTILAVSFLLISVVRFTFCYITEV